MLAALAIGACSGNREDTSLSPVDNTSPEPDTSDTATSDTDDAPPSSATTVPPTTARTPRTTDRPRRTTTTTTTTTLVPARRAHNPKCAVQIRSGDSLFAIAEAADDRDITILTLQRENRIKNPDRIDAGDLLDICVGNDVDDITGKRRPSSPPRRR